MATATAAAVEATGTRRAAKSEKFMEWQRELSSSRALHGGRKRHEETDMEAVIAVKKTALKSDGIEDGSRPQSGEHESDEREPDGGEPAGEAIASEGNGTVGAGHRARKQKQLHQRQRSDLKKVRKEQEGVDPRRGTSHVQPASKEKSPPPSSSNNTNSNADGEGARMRRCKQQQQQQSVQEQQTLQSSSSHPKRQQGADLLTPPLPQPETSLSQPLGRRRQRRVPRSTSPQKDDKDIERVLRSLTRTRGGETPPPAPAVPPGKGTKRSKRVAQRLANEEPPPPPLKLPRLHLVLTRKEIQEDWLKITGHKYTGKPKKSTIVQRGLGLCTSLTCPSSIRYLNEPQCLLTKCFM